jgi:ElaB/YqjD/DUF883 family membrane-anchored ribosome-binding protein
MSKHDSKNHSHNGPEEAATDACGCEHGSPWADVHSAADAVRVAKAEFHKAQEMYHKVRQQTADRVEAVRNTTVGDMLDCTLSPVRKHPVASLAAAVLAGICLGRLFRR